MLPQTWKQSEWPCKTKFDTPLAETFSAEGIFEFAKSGGVHQAQTVRTYCVRSFRMQYVQNRFTRVGLDQSKNLGYFCGSFAIPSHNFVASDHSSLCQLIWCSPIALLQESFINYFEMAVINSGQLCLNAIRTDSGRKSN